MRAVKRFLRRLARLGRPGRTPTSGCTRKSRTTWRIRPPNTSAPDCRRAEARRQALLKFGGVEATRERWREERGLPALDTLVQDTRHALRRLRMAPAFTIATVLILALGIGATTAIFTLVHAVLLKSLPVRDPGELYRLGREARCCYMGGYTQGQEFSLVSYQLYAQLRDRTPGFAELAAFSAGQSPFGVRRAGKAERAETYPGEFVSGNYFAMFGVRGVRRAHADACRRSSRAPPAAMMSYRLWMQRFGGAPSIVGSVFNLNDKPFTVVGITPPGFFGDTLRSAPPDFFLPLNTEPLVNSDPALTHHETHWLALIGRIQPGASPASVEARMRLELTRWLRSHWGGDERERPREDSGTDVVPASGRCRDHQHARAIPALARDPDGGDRVCAAHRLRQRGDVDARARPGAASPDVADHRAGSATVARRPRAADRKPGAVGRRRRCGPGDCLCRDARDSAGRVPFSSRAPAACPSTRGPPHRCCCSRSPCRSRRGSPSASLQRGWPHEPIRWRRFAGPAARRPAQARCRERSSIVFQAALSLVLLSAAGLLDGGPVWPGESGVRIRAGRSPGGASQSAACRIPSGPADAALRPDPRCRVARSWRLRRGALHLLAVRQQLLGHWDLGGWTCRARTE